jgi:hypothetical protein
MIASKGKLTTNALVFSDDKCNLCRVNDHCFPSSVIEMNGNVICSPIGGTLSDARVLFSMFLTQLQESSKSVRIRNRGRSSMMITASASFHAVFLGKRMDDEE